MMNRVFWTCGIKQYAPCEDFVAAVTTNCERISPEDHDWVPDKFVCNCPLIIEYELFWKDPPDDMIHFPIANSSEPITQAILLFRLNNVSYEYFREEDHKFFEGLGELDDGKMYLVTGS